MSIIIDDPHGAGMLNTGVKHTENQSIQYTQCHIICWRLVQKIHNFILKIFTLHSASAFNLHDVSSMNVQMELNMNGRATH